MDFFELLMALLTVAFVVLRLCGVIDWPWFWCLSPIIVPVIMAFVSGIIKGAADTLAKTKKDKNE